MRASLLYCLIVLLPFISLGCCCMGPTKLYPVKERVVAGERAMAESQLLGGTIVDLNDEVNPAYQAISGAKVYLAYDEKGEEPVSGYEAESNDQGFYEIDTKGIPPAHRKYDRYFLIIEKDGYQPIKQELGLGFMSPYLENTAILKPRKQ